MLKIVVFAHAKWGRKPKHKTMKKSLYERPCIEQYDIAVEQGIANSVELNSLWFDETETAL